MVGMIDKTVFNIEHKKLAEYLDNRELTGMETELLLQTTLSFMAATTTEQFIRTKKEMGL